MRRIATITDVAERHLCCGCGVCAFIQPEEIRMVDDVATGRRPIVRDGADTTPAMSCCPGIELAHDETLPGADPDLLEGWGPVLEVWEGHATDPELRYRGSSGGVANALALHGIANGGYDGAIHIRQRVDVPVLNETTYSRSRDELLAGSGSRYAPASPCDGLRHALDAPSPVAFIGKPCDVAATQKARRQMPELDAKLGITIAIFCAGAPSTQGTLELLAQLGVEDWASVRQLRYRGHGWPGRAAVTLTHDDRERSLSYADSWGGILEKYRPWRCRLCIDHTGEFADLAVGDPWHRPVGADEVGSSLVVVRSERGRQFLESAIEAGVVKLERVDHGLLPQSQPNLLQTRGAIWGRLVMSRLLAMPVPRYRNMPTARLWWRELSTVDKIRSFSGTAKRILRRRLHQRVPVVPAVDLDPAQGGEDA